MYAFRKQEVVLDGLGGELGTFGALTAYPAVKHLQKFINAVGERAGLAPIGEDQKWGDVTEGQLKLIIDYLRDHGYPLLPASSYLDTTGPLFFAPFGLFSIPPYTPFTQAELGELLMAWIEYTRSKGEIPTPDDGDGEPPAPGTPPVVIDPGLKKSGMGTVGWVLLGSAALAAGYGVYRATRTPPRRPAMRRLTRRGW